MVLCMTLFCVSWSPQSCRPTRLKIGSPVRLFVSGPSVFTSLSSSFSCCELGHLGVLRIKFWHFALCFVSVLNKRLKGSHVVYSTVLLITEDLTAAKQSLRRSLERPHRCCIRVRLPDERSTMSPRLLIRNLQYLTLTHRIRAVATGSIPSFRRAAALLTAAGAGRS